MSRDDPEQPGFATRAIRTGHRRTAEGEQSEPIFPTSSFVFDSAAHAAARFSGEEPGANGAGCKTRLFRVVTGHGIDMPAVNELVAYNRTEEEVAEEIGADWLIYQNLEDLIDAVRKGNPRIKQFDTSCFNGEYVTGDISRSYLQQLELIRNDMAKEKVAGRSPENLAIDMHNSG